jgi:multiple sugar transport system permease protein
VAATASSQQRRGLRLSMATRNQIAGMLFVLPWIIGFFAFTAYPIAASAYYSLTLYDIINDPRFIGLNNYIFMFSQDPSFPIVLYNTIYFVVLGVPVGLVVAFLFASLLNNNIVARPLFRTFFFLPSIVPSVAVAMVWLWMYNPSYGLVNASLTALGMQVIPWLGSPSLAKVSLIIINVWTQGGAIVIFLAALQDVPRELYDAAKVDGANALARFLNVTIPMCTPSVLFVLITGIIFAFQYFTIPWVMTQGGPMQSTEVYGIYLYRNAFAFFKMGYASALAWALFVVIVTSTFVMFRSSARWVYYGGG